MLVPIAMLLQAAADPAPPLPERIDLTRLLGKRECDRESKGDEIVVCARRSLKEPFRLEPLPDIYEKQPLRAETMIGPVGAGVLVEGTTVGGFTSNRVMVRLKLPF